MGKGSQSPWKSPGPLPFKRDLSGRITTRTAPIGVPEPQLRRRSASDLIAELGQSHGGGASNSATTPRRRGPNGGGGGGATPDDAARRKQQRAALVARGPEAIERGPWTKGVDAAIDARVSETRRRQRFEARIDAAIAPASPHPVTDPEQQQRWQRAAPAHRHAAARAGWHGPKKRGNGAEPPPPPAPPPPPEPHRSTRDVADVVKASLLDHPPAPRPRNRRAT